MESIKLNQEVEQNEKFSFVAAEKESLAFWDQNNIFAKSLSKTKGKKTYIFYDGPPFATGLPHHGHLLASTLKDIIPRYFTMQGYYVERRFGWDCHGLPVEQEIDKKFNRPAWEIIKETGVKGYNDECRKIIQRYTTQWRKTITRLGRWVDFDNDYKTMDTDFMESVWWVFKQLWEKKLIYEGTKVVPYSTAFGTVLSNFEAGDNYKKVQDPAVTVLFKLTDENTFLAAWTTTPWTLPSNLALCVNAEMDYVKVYDDERKIHLIIAQSRLCDYPKHLSIKEKIKGSNLSGKHYNPLFPFFSHYAKDGAFRILTDDFVSAEDGTGIVHLAPAFGVDDNRILEEADITAIPCPIDRRGVFTSECGEKLAGKYIKDADKDIIRMLKEQGRLYKQTTCVHNYPFCPRSDTPLIYKAIPSWFLAVEKFKDDLIAVNKQIHWVPDHIKNGRFGNWLESAKDWAISRNRVWGTPIPLWKNDDTQNIICIGSREELADYTGKRPNDLHRENIDALQFKVKGEKGTYRRISEVLDCWFESGSMPCAQLHYPFENKKTFKDGFPAQFIAEGLDQTRGWFYTLNVLSSAIFKKPAFKNVIVSGMVLAKDGKKMSKRLKNYTAPDILFETYGADAVRLYLITSGLVRGEEQRFSDDGLKDMIRRVLLPWMNAFKFLETYACVDKWNPREHSASSSNITDQWILSKLQTLKENIVKNMERYELYHVVPNLLNFIDDLTNWYIRFNRSRFWQEGMNTDKCAAYTTLFKTLKELTMAMAPFTPFLSEHIHRQLRQFSLGEESVHLCDWPETEKKLIDPTLEDAVLRMKQIILLGRQKRNKEQIKIKIPLPSLTIIHRNEKILDEIKKLESYIKNELNVKKVLYTKDEEKFITLTAKANNARLGKQLGADFNKFNNLIKNLDSKKLITLEQEGSLLIDRKRFDTEDILIFHKTKGDAVSNRHISIELNCELTQTLINEGLAREVVNRIQKTRKKLDLHVADRIRIRYNTSPSLTSVIEQFRHHITSETLAISIEKDPHIKECSPIQVEKDQLYLHVVKVDTQDS